MKEYKVTITEKATKDMYEITSYIGNELLDMQAANRLLEKFKVSIVSLSNMPKRHSLLQDEELAGRGIGRIVVDNYIIFYICSDKDKVVRLIRVLYHKRDWVTLI
ncbi:addiction module RelE/StbE family toxin [Natranaerovirga hydrolytica]|uniref:Addiction module RelE/StbE family toxin n=1 Tax=Natranaerovirga hydrolytica TaxID=680378 RepID=A0A4R1MQ63_9FIRM|nr:type II toxin-antitoxin system RelE/ParE family toxin [Natranaerovirga hydrolytica]TCK92659.1 addiction module RelE/StbE family toxin [Natranaerovirga hydrolytica]